MTYRDGPPGWFDRGRPRGRHGDDEKGVEMVEVAGEIRGQTDRAIQFYDGAKTVWLPKSQVEVDDDGTIWCAEWLAEKNGLI